MENSKKYLEELLRKQSEPVIPPRSDLRDTEQSLKESIQSGGENVMALTIFSKHGKTEKKPKDENHINI